MNEITKIHLGRQPFTISVEAHKALRTYLDDIAVQVGDKGAEVLKEVEIRMAELLAERGIEGDKVVLLEDVQFLKEQLGAPKDFKDDEGDAEIPSQETHDTTGPKRLYRDTQNAMVSGVSSGLGAYFGVDAVIVRLIFVVLTLAWGWGLLLYIILWLVVPEAKTSSERLQMRGKAVTVDSLKEIVDRADVQGAAQRASRSVGPFLERMFKVLGVLIGCVLVAIAVPLFLALMVGGSYLLFHHGEPLQGIMAFPVGTYETTFTIAAFVTGILAAICLLLWGVALTTRKTISAWVAGLLVALLFIAVTVGAVAAPDAISSTRNRFEAAHHTTSRTVSAFTAVHIDDRWLSYRYEKSDTYQVDIRYVGSIDTNAVKTSVKDGVLTIDIDEPITNTDCQAVCIASAHDFELIIKSPQIEGLQFDRPMVAPRPITVPEPSGGRMYISQ